MNKMITPYKCSTRTGYENNIHINSCCWNIAVDKIINETERKPKKIENKIDCNFIQSIPHWFWCPLEDCIES